MIFSVTKYCSGKEYTFSMICFVTCILAHVPFFYGSTPPPPSWDALPHNNDICHIFHLIDHTRLMMPDWVTLLIILFNGCFMNNDRKLWIGQSNSGWLGIVLNMVRWSLDLHNSWLWADRMHWFIIRQLSAHIIRCRCFDQTFVCINCNCIQSGI